MKRKNPYSRSYGFPSNHVWMWELDHKDSWASKKWCFQIVMLEKTLKIPLEERISNQLILKEINAEYSLERLMLKLQHIGHLMLRADSLEKTLGKIEDKRRRGKHRKIGWESITGLMDMNLSKL